MITYCMVMQTAYICSQVVQIDRTLVVEENRGNTAELYSVVHHVLQDGEHD